MHGELPSPVVALVMAAVFVAVAVRVNDARLTQVRSGSERGEVFAPGEAAVSELRDVRGVRGVRFGGQQQRRRRLRSTVLVMELRPVGGEVEQGVLEGEGVAESGGLLLQRVAGGSHLAQSQAPGHAGAPGPGRHPPSGAQLTSEASSQAREPAVAAEAGNRGLGRVEHVPHRLQVRDAVHSGVLEVHHRNASINT